MEQSLLYQLMCRVDWDGDGFVTPVDADLAAQKWLKLDPAKIARADELLGQARDSLVAALGVVFVEFQREKIV